ncbi:hypothetical protein D3C76_1443470 [compost metagenome]
MHDNPAVVQLDQQILGTALYAAHRPIAQRQDLLGDRPTQASVTHHRVLDVVANKIRLDTTAAGFDFW